MMFGLTKREQRWAAEQKAAETLIPLAITAIEARVAMDTNIDRVAALERDLAAAQSYATTLAVSMHRQHYAEAAPNWQPLPDLAGLLTQIDNMYAGLRNDLEAAEVENKRLVGMNLATLREDLAAAQAERDDANKECGFRIKERDEARAEVEEWKLLNTRETTVLTNECNRLRAEAAALRVRIEELERPQPNGQARKEGE